MVSVASWEILKMSSRSQSSDRRMTGSAQYRNRVHGIGPFLPHSLHKDDCLRPSHPPHFRIRYVQTLCHSSSKWFSAARTRHEQSNSSSLSAPRDGFVALRPRVHRYLFLYTSRSIVMKESCNCQRANNWDHYVPSDFHPSIRLRPTQQK